jgi:hypothetical protein
MPCQWDCGNQGKIVAAISALRPQLNNGGPQKPATLPELAGKLAKFAGKAGGITPETEWVTCQSALNRTPAIMGMLLAYPEYPIPEKVRY